MSGGRLYGARKRGKKKGTNKGGKAVRTSGWRRGKDTRRKGRGERGHSTPVEGSKQGITKEEEVGAENGAMVGLV